MKRLVGSVTALVLIFSGVGLPLVGANAAVKVGTKCTKATDLVKSGSKIYVCAKVGSKLVWKAVSASQIAKYRAQELAKTKAAADKAAADCLAAIKCAVGDTGPSGGIIFYDAGSPQSWGRYLEAAPNNWSGGPDPISIWCSVQGSLLGQVPPTRKEIGDGLYNTNVMLSWCSFGAANTAHAYQGGGKTDWFLPSMKELDQLCLYANSQTIQSSPSGCGFGRLRSGFSSGYYWSSSAAGSIMAWQLYFPTGSWVNWWWNSVKAQSGHNLGNDVSIRPIRAF